MSKTRLVISICISIGFVFYPLHTKIAETKDANSDMLFSVRPKFPENQQKNNTSYYDLRTKPSEEQTVITLLENHTDKELKIAIDYNNAKTNSNSIRDYSKNELLEDDESLVIKFNEIVSGPSEVTLQPYQVVEVETKLSMPDTPFDGVVSGGIQFSRVDQTIMGAKSNKVIMDLSYILGMTISENDKEVPEQFEFRTIKPGFVNYENAFLVSIANTAPVFVNDLTIDAEITKKGVASKVYRNKKQNVQMSPNSKIDFPVSLEKDEMQEGQYSALIRVYTQNGYKRVWEEEFVLTKQDSSYFNQQQQIFIQKEDSVKSVDILSISIILLLLVSLFLSMFYLYNKFFK